MLSTLAKHDVVVRGYKRESRAVAASVADHLKTFNNNRAKCFSTLETLAKHYATVASRLDAWDQWYTTPTECVTVVPPPPLTAPPAPEPEPAAFMAPMGAPSGLSGGGCVLPFSDHPSPDCMYHPNACADSVWPKGGKKNTNRPITRSPQLLHGGELPGNKKKPLSLSGGRCLRVRSTPWSLRRRDIVSLMQKCQGIHTTLLACGYAQWSRWRRPLVSRHFFSNVIIVDKSNLFSLLVRKSAFPLL